MMSLHNKELLAKARSVQDILKSYAFETVIAGGFARDVHFGVDAKDVDVCVINFHPHDEQEHLLFKYAYNALCKITEVVTYERDHDSYIDEPQDNHQVAIVLSLPQISIDIIFYEDRISKEDSRYSFAVTKYNEGSPITNAYELVSQFDFNINQYVIDGCFSRFLGESDPEKDGLMLVRRSLISTTKGCSRFAYMRDKSVLLGLSISAVEAEYDEEFFW